MLTRRCLPFAFAAALAALHAGCSSAPAVPTAEQKARAVAAVDVRLRGAWILQNFTPETPLEPMLVPMLQYQFGQMVIKLDGKQMVADSPGLHVVRTYRITDVEGDQFQLLAFDEQGVSYPATAVFLGDNDIRFRSTTTRWKGEGTLRRTVLPQTTTEVRTTNTPW